MAFEEFTGELDAPAGGAAFVPFSGELDAPTKPAAAKADVKTRTEPVYDPVSGAQIGTNEVADEPVAKGGALADELGSLRDSFFTGVDNTRAAVKTVNMGMVANRLDRTSKALEELVARGEGDSRNARLMRDEIASAKRQLPSVIGEMTEAQGDAQRGAALSTRPAVAKVNAAKTFGEAWEAFKEAPYDVIAGVTATSLPSTLPALAAAAVMGPGAGAVAMGASSAAVEGGSSLADFARDAGVDVTNGKAVEAFFTNPENLSAAMTYAGKRAGIIGGLDAVSGGVAGKTIAPVLKSKIARQAVNLPAQMGTQASLGAGGEALGQLATKGEIDQPGQVLMEAAGELGGAPMEVAAFSKEAREAMRPAPVGAAPAPRADPITAITSATNVDEAIAAAQAAVQSSSAVDNIAEILKQNQPVAKTEPSPVAIENIAGVAPDIAETTQAIAELEAANASQTPEITATQTAAPDQVPVGAAAGNEVQPAVSGQVLEAGGAQPVDRALDPRLVPMSQRQNAQQNIPEIIPGAPNVQDAAPRAPAQTAETAPAKAPEARARAGVRPAAAGTTTGNPAVQATRVDEPVGKTYDEMTPAEQTALDKRLGIAPGRRQEVAEQLRQQAERDAKYRREYIAAFGQKAAERMGAESSFAPQKPVDKRLVPLSKRVKLDADPAAAAQAEAVTGEPLDKQWTAFAPDSGTLAVPRADMPQIKAEHRGAMVNFLNARGISHTQEEVAASSLKPTQAEFSPGKVAQAKGFTGNDRSILVSADGHVLDGHHQWMNKLESGEPVKVIRLDAPIKQLLETVKEFPSAELARGATSAVSPARAAPAPAAQEPAPAARAPQGKQVSFYPGKYGKGMGKEAAKLEAMRLNRVNSGKGVTYAAEEHNDPKLENPYAVVGRKPVSARKEPLAQVAPAESAIEKIANKAAETPTTPPAPGKDATLAGIRDTLRTKAAETENDGDVGVLVGEKVKFVPFDEAVKAAQAAVAAGVKAVPFQIHNETNIRLGDTDRVIAALNAAAPQFSRAAPEPASPAQQATDILDAAGVTGKERLDVLKDVKAGTLTPEEVQAAYPAKEGSQPMMSRAASPGPVPALEAFKTKSGATAFKTPEIALANPRLNVKQPGGEVKRIDYEIRDRKVYAEAIKDGASPEAARDEASVGIVTLDVDAGGVFKSLRNIEVFQSKRGNAIAEKVVGGIVESLPVGAKLHIHDILPTAVGFWDKMGASFPRSEDFMEANLSPQQFRNAYDTRKSTAGTRGQPQESRAAEDAGAGSGRPGPDGAPAQGSAGRQVRNPSTVDRVQAAVAELIGGKQLPNRLGRVVATTASEIKAYWEPQIGMNVQLSADEKAGAAQAFYDPRTKTVFLIADHIPAGDEQAVAAHELMHKHGQTVLGAEGWEKLHTTINGWANAEEGSDERAVYAYARSRVEAVGMELSSQEMFPYAVEAAIKMGVKPSLIAKKGTVARWLGSVKYAMQQAWGKVTGKPETFKTQDLVDLAFGIAQMENPESAAAIGRLESKRTDPLSTPAFKAWFEGSKIVDAKGKPLRVFHGTTADFSEFQKERANPESDMGGGFYFTNMPSDVEANYAGEGPDLTNKIERRAEQIEQEMEDSDEPVDMDKARTLARKEFSEHAGATMPVYLAIKNPVVIGGKNETVFGFEQPYDEETDDYGEETGTLVDVLMALQRMGYDDMNYGQIAEDLSDAMADGGIKASELIEKLKASEGLQYATDENGNLYSTEIIRQAFEEAGFDGIIDNTVNAKFGSERSTGKKMVGMKKGVVHYIAFEPTQVKSAIGNRGTFDPAKADIRFSRAPAPGTKLSPWRDATGRLQFAPGAWLYDKIGAAAGPTLARLGLKAASPELRRQLRQMKIDIEKAQETAGAIAKETTKLSEAERAMVSDLVEQELKVGVIPPAHAVKLAAMINDAMGRQTDELVALDMLTKDSADKWRGKYLPRYYESKLSAKVGDAWADAMKRLTGRQSVMKGIKGKNLKGRGLYENIPVDQVADYEALGWEVRDPQYEEFLANPGNYKTDWTVDNREVQVWRDFTPEEREKMGEIRDAGFRFVMGYMQTGRDIAVGRMFERMAADPEQSSRLEKEGYVQVPTTTVSGTGAKVYGKLAGRWVPAETLSQLSNIEESTSAAWQMYRKAMGIWKMGKTSMNPVSHVNNMVSNLTMAHLAGVSYHRGDKYIAAARDFIKKPAMMVEAKENGLFLGTLSDTELMNTLPEELKILAQKQESKGEKVARTGFDIMTMFLRKPMGAAYQAEDTFFRYLIYKDAREQGMEPQDAVDYAQKYIFTYDDLPKGARRIRDFGIPFFSYTYKAVPALLHTALTHPVRMAAPAAVLWGINAAAYAIATGDDDDSWQDALKKYLTDPEFRAKAREKEKLEREHLPPWNKGTTALLTPKTIRLGMDEVTKLPLFIDTSRIIPGGDLFDVSPNAGGLPIPQPITPSHPLFTTLVAMLGNKDMFLGKEITDSNDTTGEKAAKRSAWLWKQLTPAITAGNYHFERGMNALAQASGGEIKWLPEVVSEKYTGIGRDGLPVQPKYAIAQTFGIKVRPVDLDTAEAIEGSMKRKMIRDIEAEIRSLQRLANKGAISDKTLEKARDLADTKKERLRDDKTVDGDDKP